MTSPIYYNKKIIGETTFGNFFFNFNKNLAFGYIDSNIDINKVKNEFFEIEVAKIKYKAHLKLESLHDPNNKNMKS